MIYITNEIARLRVLLSMGIKFKEYDLKNVNCCISSKV